MELIKVRNASLVLYEEVLRKKENLRRDARQFEIRYLQEFGDLLAEVFEAKVECIAVKKRIAYCQRCRNRGQEIDRRKLDQYMNEEMKEYYTHLEEIKDEIRNARKAEAVSALERMRIREIYYRLARKIHPDMRPDLAEDQKLKAYWNRILMAYQCSRLADLEELETLVNMYLTESGIGEADYEIEDVEKKIERTEAEIEEILNSEPYIYRMVLEDEAEMERRKQELEEELKRYEHYQEELNEVLAQFAVREMYA